MPSCFLCLYVRRRPSISAPWVGDGVNPVMFSWQPQPVQIWDFQVWKPWQSSQLWTNQGLTGRNKGDLNVSHYSYVSYSNNDVNTDDVLLSSYADQMSGAAVSCHEWSSKGGDRVEQVVHRRLRSVVVPRSCLVHRALHSVTTEQHNVETMKPTM